MPKQRESILCKEALQSIVRTVEPVNLQSSVMQNAMINKLNKL
jgi:hypothetical protein